MYLRGSGVKTVKPNAKQEIGDFWLAELGPVGPVDVNLPPDDEPRGLGTRRKRREKALQLIKKYGGLYEAEAAPEWVIKCIMNVDRFYWKQLEKTIGDVEALRQDLKLIKADAGAPLRDALQRIEDLQRVEKENEELRQTLAVAEATAAAATAELLQTRSGLTRLQSSRAMKTHRLAESMASARREVRLKRRDGMQSALELARTRARNKQLEGETAELAHQLETMGLHLEQQRALFTAKVADLREEVKPKRKKCQWCGPRVCPIPVVAAKAKKRPVTA